MAAVSQTFTGSPNVRVVLDTSVLIDHLRGSPAGATRVIPEALEREDDLWSSQLVRAELLAGMKPSEERVTRDLLSLITWADVDETLAEAAAALGRRFLRSHPGIGVTDLVVAALAEQLDAELATVNVKHFPMFPRLRPAY